MGFFSGKARVLKVFGGAALVVGVGAYLFNTVRPSAPDEGKLGGPLPGLTARQLALFYKTKETFKKEFTPAEGLGPLFNGKSCFECHGQPGVVGGEGRDTSSTNIVNFAKRVGPKAAKPMSEVIANLGRSDCDVYLNAGGPSMQRRSITTEFPNLYPFECQLDFDKIPVEADIQSPRHSPPVFGDGLIDQIPDQEILRNALDQSVHPLMAGRPLPEVDRYTESARIGHLGWKAQNINLFNFTTQAMNIEMGLTTFQNAVENSSTQFGSLPSCIMRQLPPRIDDTGKILVELNYFQSMLAPPPRGEITEQVKRGERLFDRTGCIICHKPDAHTVPRAYVPDPESPIPKLKYMHVEALSNKTFHPYSDFLLHDMGVELADGFPQEGAKSGEWRTTPLWGLRFKKFLLHDGRTTSRHQAIMVHGGQGRYSKEAYEKLTKEEKEDLLAFLNSL